MVFSAKTDLKPNIRNIIGRCNEGRIRDQTASLSHQIHARIPRHQAQPRGDVIQTLTGPTNDCRPQPELQTRHVPPTSTTVRTERQAHSTAQCNLHPIRIRGFKNPNDSNYHGLTRIPMIQERPQRDPSQSRNGLDRERLSNAATGHHADQRQPSGSADNVGERRAGRDRLRWWNPRRTASLAPGSTAWRSVSSAPTIKFSNGSNHDVTTSF